MCKHQFEGGKEGDMRTKKGRIQHTTEESVNLIIVRSRSRGPTTRWVPMEKLYSIVVGVRLRFYGRWCIGELSAHRNLAAKSRKGRGER